MATLTVTITYENEDCPKVAPLAQNNPEMMLIQVAGYLEALAGGMRVGTASVSDSTGTVVISK